MTEIVAVANAAFTMGRGHKEVKGRKVPKQFINVNLPRSPDL